MSTLIGTRDFRNYREAEQFADEWAGDNQAHAAVVELGEAGSSAHSFSVMDYSRALDLLDDGYDVEIVYDADQTEATRRRMAGE